jgi:hypothetical protein
LVDGAIDRTALAHWTLARLAFIGEWLPRESLAGVLGWNASDLGLSPAEASECFDRVREIVGQVSIDGAYAMRVRIHRGARDQTKRCTKGVA